MKSYLYKPLEVNAIQWNLENAKQFEEFLGSVFYKYQCFEGGRLVIIPVQGFTMVLEIGDWLVEDWDKKLFTLTNKEFNARFGVKIEEIKIFTD